LEDGSADTREVVTSAPSDGKWQKRGGLCGTVRRVLDSRWSAAYRWLGTIALSDRALSQCLGARAALWLSRSVALSFAITLYWFVRTAPDMLDVVLRLGIIALSWCAGLAALSAAGSAPEAALTAARGVLANRGLSLEVARRQRPLAAALWIGKHTGLLCLLLVVLAFGLTPEPARALHFVRVGAGVAFYVIALGLGLGLLAHVCGTLSRQRGQTLLILLIWLPEALSAAYPELPGFVSTYGHLLTRCLGGHAA
jgi:hypothetical protein